MWTLRYDIMHVSVKILLVKTSFLVSRLTEAGDDQSDEEGEENVAPSEPPADPNDEFNFENYDQEDNSKFPFKKEKVASFCS